MSRNEKFDFLFLIDAESCFVFDPSLHLLAVNKQHFIFQEKEEFSEGLILSKEVLEKIFGREAGANLESAFRRAASLSKAESPLLLNFDTQPCRVTIRPVLAGSGEAALFVCRVEDISEVVRLRELLEVTRKNTESVTAAKNAFVANMSHEIRTPLSAILGFTDILVDPSYTSHEQQIAMTTIKRNCEHLSKLVDEVLDLSKIEAGRLEIEILNFNLFEVLEYVQALGSFKSQMKGISFRMTIDRSVPRNITTDPTRLRQILLNIMGNAIKFTPRGQVELKVERMSSVGPEGFPILKFTVTDTGIGIAQEDQQRLFSPFIQSDSSMTRRFGGTGLGLILSRRLAQALGGDVLIASSSEKSGSRFEITIENRIEGERPQVTGRDLSRRVEEIVQVSGTSFRQLNILVVDDCADNCSLIEHMLKSTSAQVRRAMNGSEGLQLALKDEFDVILMDIQMPEMDGFETLQKLRAGGYRKPVIALTANALKEDRELAFRAGFDDHLSKPLCKDNLLSTIAHFAAKIKKTGLRETESLT